MAKLQEVVPTYHLEDKVSLLGRGIDKHKHKPHITKVYTCKQQAREAVIMDHQQHGTQHPRGANHPIVTTHPKDVNHPIVMIHPKGAKSEDVNQGNMILGNSRNQLKDVNQGDMTLGNSHNQPL